ncbi:Molybdopterin biosynthesis MoaE [Thamnocephalis sphaerospora]|uniref:Molybdopterin synthase catalytic subunit n=1 Tax=Thamnocephalis sphaerospora TaxID=78915 RepID=A0A4P9XGC3_9FUNG|nr:Molybdopterin biosynthesis MoaE [Thamnocephalis sphaerospora]|eukprot:RKP04685.1 Molybdopterin biosynthesis MoaE [Thamnocephalis sphaerospora]
MALPSNDAKSLPTQQPTAIGDDLYVVTDTRLSLEQLADQVRDDGAGAVVTFSGTTRNHFQGRRVLRLDYEAYAPMAEAEMRKIGDEARSRWALIRIGVWHRTGTVPVGETSIVIAVSSAHRHDALQAASYMIDELKARVPIWKKEVLADGEAEWRANAEAKRSAA